MDVCLKYPKFKGAKLGSTQVFTKEKISPQKIIFCYVIPTHMRYSGESQTCSINNLSSITIRIVCGDGAICSQKFSIYSNKKGNSLSSKNRQVLDSVYFKTLPKNDPDHELLVLAKAKSIINVN